MYQTSDQQCRSKLIQEPDIILVKQTDIMDAIADHGDALDAETERPTAPHFGIVSDIFKNLRMHHSAAGNFQPVFAHLFHERAGEVDFEAGLGVAEIVRAEAEFDFVAEKFFENEFDRAFQVSNGDIFINVKSFDLME